MSHNPEVAGLMAEIHRAIYEIAYEIFGKFVTDDGKLALRSAPVQGPLGTAGGGTSTTWGFKDHGHAGGSDGQQLAEANTHQSLDTAPTTRKHWAREDLQDMIAAFLVDSHGAPFAYNDSGNLLTIAAAGALDDLTDVVITDPQEGDMLVYVSGMWRNIHGLADPDLLYWDSAGLEWGGEPLHWG